MKPIKKSGCLCFSKKNQNLEIFYSYDSPPPKEPNYKIKKYKRKIMRCKICGHFTAKHNIKVQDFYKKNYSIISHGKQMIKKFKYINKLKEKSDNYHRVKRVLLYFKKILKGDVCLLDVGSGLSVFLYQLQKKVKWYLIGVEPDINSVRFARKMKLNVIHSNFRYSLFKGKVFNIITMNKIIEHVKSPVSLLKISKKLLSKNGYVYIEVPDGEAASKSLEGKERQEFFVDHLHVFTKKSLKRCIQLSGLKLLRMKNIRERSGKFTIFAFAKKI